MQQVPYDLSETPIYALIVTNCYEKESSLPPLGDRKNNGELMRKTLCGDNRVGFLSTLENGTSAEIKAIVQTFISHVRKAVNEYGYAVTLFYFSGYGTRREADTDQAILCGNDYTDRTRGDAFRLEADYLHALEEMPGLHMLLMDCSDINQSPHFTFAIPNLPPRFHALHTEERQAGDTTTLTSPLTQIWCAQSHIPSSLEEHAKRVRISMLLGSSTPYKAYESSTLLNHFEFS